MSDAERQAHAAGEFDEAAAMRRDSPPPAEDLESGFDAWWDSHEPIEPEPSRYEIAKVAWMAAGRASLERLSQREDVIARLDREVEGHIELIVETQRSRDAALARERELREALEELVGDPDPDGIKGKGQFILYFVDAVKYERAKALLAQPAAGKETK